MKARFTWHKGYRIDDRRKSKAFGCWKVRHDAGQSYIALDFKSLKAAKTFLDKQLGG